MIYIDIGIAVVLLGLALIFKSVVFGVLFIYAVGWIIFVLRRK